MGKFTKFNETGRYAGFHRAITISAARESEMPVINNLYDTQVPNVVQRQIR